MQSRIVAVFDRTKFDFVEDISRLIGFTGDNEQYSEFRIGDWKTFVLWNSSGRDDDGLVASSQRGATVTPRGQTLGAVNRFIESTFHLDRLKLVRAHTLGDGVLIPHRDFVELNDDARKWVRVHVPIQTNEGCLHSENGTAFCMKPGEIWVLHAANAHSACNFSDTRRINLCLDFDVGEDPIETVIKDPSMTAGLPAPSLVERPAMNDTFKHGLYELAKVIDHRNYRDLIGLLAKVHFYKDVDIREFHDWLIDISDLSGNAALYEKSKAFKTFLMERREMHERFAL